MKRGSLMRRLWGLVLSAGLLCVPAGYAAQSAETESQAPDRQQCAAFARERKKLEKSGIRQLVEMAPGDVVSQFGQDGERRVYAYIRLSERVLFQCPPHVLNANVAPIGIHVGAVPPLPRKGPRRPKTKAKRSQRLIVPLPVRAPLRQSNRFKVPASQG